TTRSSPRTNTRTSLPFACTLHTDGGPRALPGSLAAPAGGVSALIVWFVLSGAMVVPSSVVPGVDGVGAPPLTTPPSEMPGSVPGVSGVIVVSPFETSGASVFTDGPAGVVSSTVSMLVSNDAGSGIDAAGAATDLYATGVAATV